MGTARTICRMPLIPVIAILVLCVGLGTWGFMSAASKVVKSLVDKAVSKYDVYFPEITIKNGMASIREQQPYYIDLFGGKKTEDLPVLVIDTREGQEKDAVDYLKDARSGAVLTRKTLVFKDNRQIRIVPLKDIPDTVINSHAIGELSSKYLPMLTRWAAVILVFYFLLAKPAQALLLAMIPYFAARAYAADATYGQSLKIAIVAMAPAVLIDLVQDLLHMRIPAAYVLYFVIYVGVIVLITRDLVATPLTSAGPAQQIHPS